MANERLTLQIDTKTTGSAEVQALSDALNKVVSISEKAGKSGSAFSSFPSAIKSFVQDPLGSAEKSLTSFASGFGVLGIGIASGIGALSALAVASASATRELADLGVSTRDISLKLGLSTKEVGQFSFAARAVGQDIGVFETGMRKLSQGLADGGEEGKKAREALAELGVGTRTLTGDIRPMADIFQQIAAGISKIESPAKRNAEIVKIFGRAGIELIPVLEDLNKNLARAQELKLGLSDTQLAKMLKYKEQIVEVDTAWARAKRHLSEGIAGKITLELEGFAAYLLDPQRNNAGAGVGSGGLGYVPRRTPESSFTIPRLGDGISGQLGPVLEGGGIGRDESAFRSTLAGAQSALEDAKGKASEARADYFGSKGQVTEDVAQRKRQAWQAAEAAAKGYEEQVKILSKIEAQYVAFLEKSAVLKREGEGYLTFQGADGRAIVTGTEQASANGSFGRKGPPSLYRGGEYNPNFADNRSTDLTPGLQSNGSFVTGAEDPWTRDAAELSSRQGSAFLAGQTEKVSRDNQIKLDGLRNELDYTSQIVELRAGPGGELAAALKINDLRLTAAEKEFEVTNDLVALEDRRTKLAYERSEALEQKKRKDVEDFRQEVGSIFDALASRQPGALANVLKSNVLSIGRTVTENAAKEYLLPALQKATPHFGKLFEGTPFGPDPLKSATDLNTTATIANTAALNGLRTIAGSASGGGGGVVSGAIAGGYGSPGNFYAGVGEDGLPIRSTNTSLFPSFSGSSGSTSALSNFESGAGSVFSGQAIKVVGDSGFNTATRVGAGVGLGAAAVGGGLTAYSQFKKGGAQGAMGGTGAILGTAAAFDPEPISRAVLTVAAIALPMLGSMFDSKQRRANQINQELESNKYQAPTALNVTQSSSGTFASFDARGNIRTSNFSPFPNVTNPSLWEQTHGLFGGPPTWYDVPGRVNSQFGAPVQAPPVVQHIYQAGSIQTMDAQSFHDFAHRNAHSIGDAAATALQNSHSRLAGAVQYVAGR
jgi:hypothetical protein